MKIDELKINSYGKLKNKDIKFENGINIVYGENEKGKSTLLNFIVNSLYGASKNKKGKIMSDYDRYKPWDVEEFSGKISYTLDNNKAYQVYREFGKKNPQIYDENMEDVSKQYSIDKTAGNQFFVEQTNVDEQSFTSAVVSFQNEVEIDGQTQNVLLQKMANSSSTGDDGISYKKAIERLSKKQLEEIGTSRSQGKPVNIVVNEINKINEKNEYLKQYENYKYEIEDKTSGYEKEVQNLKNKLSFLTKAEKVKQEENIELAKLKYSENRIDEVEEEIQKLIDAKKQIEKRKVQTKNQGNVSHSKNASTNTKICFIVSIIFVIVAIILLLTIKNKVPAIIASIIGITIAILGLTKLSSLKKRNKELDENNSKIINENRELERKIYEIDAKLDLLEKNKNSEIDGYENLKSTILNNASIKNDEIISEYQGKINSEIISEMLNTKDLSFEINNVQQAINNKELELHRLKLDKDNILPKLEELAQNEEKLSENKAIYQELKEKNDAIVLAKEVLEQAYTKMKNEVTPAFTQNISNNVSKITGGKYQKIAINEDDGILVEMPNGAYKSANQLSLGTIEQLYLSFRLSVIENLSAERMPIILDEVFAFFDDTRLKETLKNLNNEYAKNHQIIIFTCTRREEHILNEIGYKFNKVEL